MDAGETLDDKLRAWVENLEINGIKQQTDAWHVARMATIGGSSMATIQGINPYATIGRLIRERLGLAKFAGDIKPQWGNLFEDILKRFVEHILSCTIRGEDLYVLGRPGTSYSPDGLAVVSRAQVLKRCIGYDPDDFRAYPREEIALMEFKCPYSRLPNGTAPKYYVPQVLMGLDLLQLPTFGIYVEAVIRRCTWDQCGLNDSCDTTLVARTSGNVQAFGVTGFYIDREVLAATKYPTIDILGRYREHYITPGDNTNMYQCNDLGDCPVDLFTMIMDAMDKRLVTIRHYGIYYTDCTEGLDADLAAHTEFCRESNHINFGILPWKIFRVDFHTIDKIEGYLEKWYPIISEIVNVINICRDLPPEEQEKIIAAKYGVDAPKKAYVPRPQPVGFSDD
jgi:hypothetical protein